jgi:hypothetical protein
MNIQVRTNNDESIFYDNLIEVFSSRKKINKISFDNPRTNKMIRLLYDEESNMWIQTPLFYNLVDSDMSQQSIDKINNKYEPYQKYTKEEVINAFNL